MRKYEVMYILKSELEQDAVQSAIEKFEGIINNGGEITKSEIMGKRRLAYEIDDYRDGIYVLVNFNATSEVVAELDRVMKISDEIIRYLIVKDAA
ncbi:30S ribosomal protein S6 [Paenibacillus senegalensis]|uniref:30S ribosomal protein S6 n=1 Tax=Paenibacillus senegalensis TaxID=1465766 RepID=UPI000288BFAB|nr:30S ribosomal protein S6 [Paenibacillus senegalensis]